MSAVTRFALPVAVVFGSLIAYGGVVAGVAAAQGPDYDYYGASDGDGYGDSESGGSSDGDGTAGGAGEPETPVEEAVAPSSLPSSCDALFSSSMRANVEGAGLALNPSWASGTLAYGSINDSNLQSKISDLPQLSCRWLTPGGGGEVGIDTTVAVVTHDQALAIDTRLASLGYTPIYELGGTRYVWEVAYSEGYAAGESHIVRGDLWFATHWLNYGPNGYTADMVHNVFG